MQRLWRHRERMQAGGVVMADTCAPCGLARTFAVEGQCNVPIPAPQPDDCLMVQLEQSLTERDRQQPVETVSSDLLAPTAESQSNSSA